MKHSQECLKGWLDSRKNLVKVVLTEYKESKDETR